MTTNTRKCESINLLKQIHSDILLLTQMLYSMYSLVYENRFLFCFEVWAAWAADGLPYLPHLHPRLRGQDEISRHHPRHKVSAGDSETIVKSRLY